MGLADALQGFGAGVQGQGQQFLQGRQQQQEREETKTKQLSQERRQAMLIDNRIALDHITKGNFQGAEGLLKNRLDALSKIPDADPTETLGAYNIIRSKNPEDIKRLTGIMSDLDQRAVLEGFLPEMAQPAQKKLIETKDGRATFLNPDMTVSEEAVFGAVQDAPEKIKFTDLRAVNNDVGALVAEANKIRASAAGLDKLSKTKSNSDQLAAVFTFMKALDPSSVVRETEQDMLKKSGGVADSMVVYFNRLMNGDTLPPALFDEMVLTAKRLANQRIEDSSTAATSYLAGFGDKIPQKQRGELMGRVPAMFAMNEAPATLEVLPTSTTSGKIQRESTANKFPGFSIEP
jgi:hypothetical protein